MKDELATRERRRQPMDASAVRLGGVCVWCCRKQLSKHLEEKRQNKNKTEDAGKNIMRQTKIIIKNKGEEQSPLSSRPDPGAVRTVCVRASKR